MKKAACQFEIRHDRNESLRVTRSQVQNDGGTIREAESSAVIELHICTMVDPFVLSNLSEVMIFLMNLYWPWKYLVPEFNSFTSPILIFTNSVQISLGRSNHHISIKDSYCVWCWLALKELRDCTVLSSGYKNINRISMSFIDVSCQPKFKMEHHYQPLTELHQKKLPNAARELKKKSRKWRQSPYSEALNTCIL